jgi:hypothetical protein
MDQDYLIRLTKNIETCNDVESVTVNYLYDLLWPDVQQLIKDPQKMAILGEWQFGEDFNGAELAHANETLSHFDLLTPEKSFIMYLYMCIYH